MINCNNTSLIIVLWNIDWLSYRDKGLQFIKGFVIFFPLKKQYVTLWNKNHNIIYENSIDHRMQWLKVNWRHLI